MCSKIWDTFWQIGNIQYVAPSFFHRLPQPQKSGSRKNKQLFIEHYPNPLGLTLVVEKNVQNEGIQITGNWICEPKNWKQDILLMPTPNQISNQTSS